LDHRKKLQDEYLAGRSITTEAPPIIPSNITNRNINFLQALEYGDLQYIKGAFDFGNIDVNSLSIDKKTPLLLVAVKTKCNFHILQYLLFKGAYKILDKYSVHNINTPRQLILSKCKDSADYANVKQLLARYLKVANPAQDFCIDNNLAVKEDFFPYKGNRFFTFSLLERLSVEFFIGLLNGTMPFAVSKIKSKLITRYPLYKQTINRIGNFFVLPLASTSINLIHASFVGPTSFLMRHKAYEEEVSIIPSVEFYFGSSLLCATAIQGIRSIVKHFIGEGKISQVLNLIFFLHSMAMLLTSKDFEENPLPASAGYAINILSSIAMATLLQYLGNRTQKKIVIDIDNCEEIIELNSANKNTKNLSSSNSSFDSDSDHHEVSDHIYQNVNQKPSHQFSSKKIVTHLTQLFPMEKQGSIELQEKLALQRFKNGL